jgi:hypothetical protein
MPDEQFNAQTELPAQVSPDRVALDPGVSALSEPAAAGSDIALWIGDAPRWLRAGEGALAIARAVLYRALAVCLLLWVALYNAYPTVYPDTGGYIYTGAFGIALPPFRSPGYSVFIRLTSFGLSPWITVVVQAILVVFVLSALCRYLIGGDSRFRDRCLVLITAALAALTSLPWETSLVMPDVFAGVVFLALFLLAFNDELMWIERFVLAAIAGVGVGAHISLLPIAALFVAGLVATQVFFNVRGWRPAQVPSVRSILAWLAIPLLAAGIWTANLNREMGLGFQVSPSGNEFLLGRLLGDGLAADFLREDCPKRPFVACRYLGNLPKTPEQLLFWHPMLHEMDKREVAEIVHGTLAAYPLRFAWNSFKHSLRQFVQFKTGDEVRDLALHATNSNGLVMLEVFPRDIEAYSTSRLIQGRLIGLTKVVAGADTAAFWLAAIACAFIAVKSRDKKWNQFLYAAIGFLFINAAVCATFAGVYDRYQSRVAWIIPLCLATFIGRHVSEARPDSGLRGDFQ